MVTYVKNLPQYLCDSFIQDLAMVNMDRCGWNDFGLILFNFLDKNKDGCVSRREMRKSIKKIGRKCRESEVSGWKLWISHTDFSRKPPYLILIICVFICRNLCNSQSIAIQPLDFSQILSKKRNFLFLLFSRKWNLTDQDFLGFMDKYSLKLSGWIGYYRSFL